MAEHNSTEGSVSGHGLSICVVVARWNELITDKLLEGALDELKRAGASDIEVVRVPGSWEVPVAISAKLASKSPPDAFVALGCILMGETAHGTLLSSDVSSVLMKLQVESKIPISWGILTPDTPQQALDRTGLKMGNKGREAAQAAIEMAHVAKKLRS